MAIALGTLLLVALCAVVALSVAWAGKRKELQRELDRQPPRPTVPVYARNSGGKIT